MSILSHLESNRVFYYFEEICAIPRGSGNQNAIGQYCVDFAERCELSSLRDSAGNVIIFKAGTKGYETSKPIILQGHLDMVCQKTKNSDINFLTDGIQIYIDGDYIKAKETTLGADNGIAIAMILAILESKTISHPPIEAVFTTDEEIGMIGASNLSFEHLKGKRMLNLDSEDPKTLTVSCAGGSEVAMTLPISRKTVYGTRVVLSLHGLKGGHSGVEINAGRINADILAGRVFNEISKTVSYELIGIYGGDKGNAIPCFCNIEFVVQDSDPFIKTLEKTLDNLKDEIADREEDFRTIIERKEDGNFSVLDETCRKKLMFILLHVPNGVVEMSASVDNLVETSLNLGILETVSDSVTLLFTLRSNKASALAFLEDRLISFANYLGCQTEISGQYPPWELYKDSEMQRNYIKVYREKYGEEPIVTAIHAGLECAVFASKIHGLDCISIGPEMLDIHTTGERLSISSTDATYQMVLSLLKECK